MRKNKVQKRVRAKMSVPVQLSPVSHTKPWDNVDEVSPYRTPIVRSRDLSLNGIFIETDFKIPVGDACIIELHLDEMTSLSIRGEVIRHDKNGMGIVFFEMNQLSYQRLKEIVFDNTKERVKFLKQIQNSIGYKTQ